MLVPVPVGHPLRMASGYAYEHRLAAAEAAGRPLFPGEEVHHLAGRADNAPALLTIKAKAEHARAHARAAARERGGRAYGPPLNPRCLWRMHSHDRLPPRGRGSMVARDALATALRACDLATIQEEVARELRRRGGE